MVPSMMSLTKLLVYLWGHALHSVIHLLNRMSSKSISTIPYELWYGKKSRLSYLKIWRCPVLESRIGYMCRFQNFLIAVEKQTG